MMEILKNMEGQWEAFPHPSYSSNSTLIDRESQRNGKNGIRKGSMPSRLHLALKRKMSSWHLNIRIGGNSAKKEVKSKTNEPGLPWWHSH